MSYEPVTIRDAAQLEVLLFVGLAFVGALGIVYWGFQTYRFGRIIRDTPPEPVRSVSMGRTEVKGDIEPAERVFDQPFTEGKCVYGEYRVREYEEADDDDEDDKWKTVETGSFGTPFYIDDGTGKIRIDPTEETVYEISDEHSTRISVGKRSNPPSEVQEFLSSAPSEDDDSSDDDDSSGLLGRIVGAIYSNPSDDGEDELDDVETDLDWEEEAEKTEGDDIEHVRRSEIGDSSTTSQKRRYIQEVLPLDEETYVFGGAERQSPDDVTDDIDEVIQTDPSTEEFIVSDMDEFDLAKQYSRRSILYMVSGIIASAMVLALLVQILITGPLYGVDAALPWVIPW